MTIELQIEAKIRMVRLFREHGAYYSRIISDLNREIIELYKIKYLYKIN